MGIGSPAALNFTNNRPTTQDTPLDRPEYTLSSPSSEQVFTRLSNGAALQDMKMPSSHGQVSIASIHTLIPAQESKNTPKIPVQSTERSLPDSMHSLFVNIGAEIFEDMSNVNLVPMEAKHKESVYLLLDTAFPHMIQVAMQDINKFLSQSASEKTTCFWILTAPGTDKAVGITGLYHEDDKLWLNWFTVHPEYRQGGLGKKLLTMAKEVAKKTGDYKYLYVDTSNRPSQSLAQKLYMLMGFELYHQEKSKISEYTLLFRKAQLHPAENSV